MKKVLVLAALALAVSVGSASAKPAKHHHAKVATDGLYDYVAPAPAANSGPMIPLILGVAY